MSDQIVGFTVILPEGQGWSPPPAFQPAFDDVQAMAKRYGLELHLIQEDAPREKVLSGTVGEIIGDRLLTIPKEWT